MDVDVDVEVNGYEVQEHCNGTSRPFRYYL